MQYLSFPIVPRLNIFKSPRTMHGIIHHSPAFWGFLNQDRVWSLDRSSFCSRRGPGRMGIVLCRKLHLLSVRCLLRDSPYLHGLVQASTIHNPPLLSHGGLVIFLHRQALDRACVACENRQTAVDTTLVPLPHAYTLIGGAAEHEVSGGSQAQNRVFVAP